MAGLSRSFCFSLVGCFWLTMSVCMASCTRDEMEIRVSVRTMKQPEPLAHVLGNSYSNDSFSYVPFILMEYGVTSCIHIYYRGSLSLHDLDEQWEDDSEYGLADLDKGKHNRFHFPIYAIAHGKLYRFHGCFNIRLQKCKSVSDCVFHKRGMEYYQKRNSDQRGLCQRRMVAFQRVFLRAEL